jgi:hypothetical protein
MINGEAPLLRRDTGNLAGLMHFNRRDLNFRIWRPLERHGRGPKDSAN